MKETAYLLQAALISACWLGLASHRAFFEAFQFEGIPPTAFWAFLAPDVILIALFSVIRAYRAEPILEYIVLGAFGYASLYCLNATFLTGSGFLPTGLMLLGLAYNLFLCFQESLFRSSNSSLHRNILKTLAQVICIWILALGVIPFVLLDAFGEAVWPARSMWFVAGGALFLSASLLGLTSAFYMVRDGDGTPLPLDQTNQLVVSGPYRFIRNPMALAGILQGLSIAIVFQSVPILVYSLLGAVIWHAVVRPVEERDMVERFGDSYLEYRSKVRCWLPRFGGSRNR